MSYVIPPHRAGPVGEVLGLLSGAGSVILTTHVNADGDGAGSEVALASWIRDRGGTAWIVNPTPIPDTFRFLLPDPSWSLDAGSREAREVAEKADLAVVLDTGELPRIGRVADLIRDRATVVVDHHPPGPDPIPGVALRDPAAAATGELVFDLFTAAGSDWPKAAALGLYVALLTDTGSFRFSNASPRVHRMVADLLERGVRPEDTYRRLYGNYPARRLHLLHACLGTLEVDPEGGVAWMTVPAEVYDSLSATVDDLEGLVDYPREIRGVEVGLLFRETARGGTKISFRANGDVDVNSLARRFGGGGHVKAAGALVERPLPEVRQEVLEATRSAVRSRAEKREER